VTKDSKKHFADVTVFACGSWSPFLVPELDSVLMSLAHPVIHFKLPQAMLPLFSPPQFCVWSADITQTGFYGFPVTSDGILKLAHHGVGYVPSDENPNKTRNPAIPKQAVLAYRQFLDRAFPTLNQLDIAYTRMCYYNDTMDGDFLISNSPTMKGLVYATGGSGHAYKFMPVLGEIVLDVIQGRSSPATERFKWRKTSIEKVDVCRQLNPEKMILYSHADLAQPKDLLATSYKGKL
jgi:glycine/D-amino acid oxidase-like deaminating enzyme